LDEEYPGLVSFPSIVVVCIYHIPLKVFVTDIVNRGHQAPAWVVEIEGQVADEADNNSWVTGRSEEEAHAKAAAKFPGQKFTLRRDEDVLDTWFSSGLWPFATLGWPNAEHPDFTKLFPTSVLETGWDILFFWVA
jgi:valyl-tRNA synthetase